MNVFGIKYQVQPQYKTQQGEKIMKTSKICILASLCGIALMTAGCETCPTHTHHRHQYEQNQKMHKKHHHNKNMQNSETVIFYQTYEDSDIDNVHGKMFTRSSRGGESEMGIIKFKETNDGLKMNVDLIDLRPGKTYTAQIYQCGACNDSTCCDVSPMSVDLPQIKIAKAGRLQKSYIIRGLTATQLNNARLVLTRDGGYKAAWGTLNQQ